MSATCKEALVHVCIWSNLLPYSLSVKVVEHIAMRTGDDKIGVSVGKVKWLQKNVYS